MRVLVIGSGGREHALAWKVSKSPLVKKVFMAPGNPGTHELGTNVSIPATSIRDLADFALGQEIDLTIVGPEQPLSLGIVDLFRERGLKCFGPSLEAARVETSKVWSKAIMQKAGVPTASYKAFNEAAGALAYVKRADLPVVIKADGLAAGKGVIIARTGKEAVEAIEQVMVARAFGESGSTVVVEEYLEGEEISILAVCNGKSYCLLPSSQDHKAAYDGGEGPNTGGMGAYSPMPRFTSALEEKVRDRIIEPTLWALEKEACPYTGVLYCGLMLTEHGPKVLEYNARLGDPEAQVVLPTMDVDLVELALSAIHGNPSSYEPKPTGAAACVVMAASGYPGSYKKGEAIRGIEKARAIRGVEVFHAGTELTSGRLYTSGGRVLGVTAVAQNLKEAVDSAYRAVSQIEWDGVHYRKDIGRKGLRT